MAALGPKHKYSLRDQVEHFKVLLDSFPKSASVGLLRVDGYTVHDVLVIYDSN